MEMHVSWFEADLLKELANRKTDLLWKGMSLYPQVKLQGNHALYKVYLAVREVPIRDTYKVFLVIPPLGLEVTKEVSWKDCSVPHQQNALFTSLFAELRKEVEALPYA